MTTMIHPVRDEAGDVLGTVSQDGEQFHATRRGRAEWDGHPITLELGAFDSLDAAALAIESCDAPR